MLYHSFKTKTEEEKAALDEKKSKQIDEKEERKRVQVENVRAKEKARIDDKKYQEKVCTRKVVFHVWRACL